MAVGFAIALTGHLRLKHGVAEWAIESAPFRFRIRSARQEKCKTNKEELFGACEPLVWG